MRDERAAENEYLEQTKKFHQSPPLIFDCAMIFDAFYHGDMLPAGRKGMLISRGVFTTQVPACFTFMKFFVRLILSTEAKERENFP